MTLDPDIARELQRAQTEGLPAITGGTAAQARERYRAQLRRRRGAGFAPEPVADVRHLAIAGPAGPLEVRVFIPAGARQATVVFLHGGGWVVGDLDSHEAICRRLANATRALVAAIDYRRAPEAPHPWPLDDAMAGVRWAAAAWPGHRLAVAGDSAGGGLAAGCTLRARAAREPALAAQLLVYPALDPRMTQPSVSQNADGYGLSQADMRWYYDQYLPAPALRDDPEVNLLVASDLSGLPPAVIAVAGFDPLRDEGALYAQRLRAAGVPVTLIESPELVHGYLQMTDLSSAAAREADRVLTAFAALL